MHYFDHSIIPIFHSRRVPAIRRDSKNIIFHILNWFVSSNLMNGINKEISISKIINNKAIIKN